MAETTFRMRIELLYFQVYLSVFCSFFWGRGQLSGMVGSVTLEYACSEKVVCVNPSIEVAIKQSTVTSRLKMHIKRLKKDMSTTKEFIGDVKTFLLLLIIFLKHNFGLSFAHSVKQTVKCAYIALYMQTVINQQNRKCERKMICQRINRLLESSKIDECVF